MLKERARKMVEIEAKEDQAATELQKTAQSSSQPKIPCQLASDENNTDDSGCSDLGRLPSNRDGNNPGTNLPRNDQQF